MNATNMKLSDTALSQIVGGKSRGHGKSNNQGTITLSVGLQFAASISGPANTVACLLANQGLLGLIGFRGLATTM